MTTKIFLTSLLCSSALMTQAIADTSVWNGLGSDNDLNTATNWIPDDHVPTSTEVAAFNSAVSNINTSPTATGIDFSVDSLDFPNLASPFALNFNNCRLVLNGNGITGTHTDTSIFVNNIDNSSSVDSNIELSGINNMGNALIQLTNSGSLSGSTTGTYISRIDSRQVNVYGPFTLLSGGQLVASNSGIDSTTGGGGNVVAEISYEQARFSDTVTLGDNVIFSFTNTGLNSSSGNTTGTSVADTEEGEIYIGDAFNAGDSLFCFVSNSGTDSSTGVGGNYTGYISGTAQLEYDSDATFGNQAVVSIHNSGQFTGTNSTDRNMTGYVSDEQLYVNNTLSAGNSFSATLSNEGIDSSAGIGDNRTGYINSYQLYTSGPVNLAGKDAASFLVSNHGVYTGSSTSTGNIVGWTSDMQVYFSDTFEAGDALLISVTNSGEDHGTGSVNDNFVGFVNGRQLYFGNTCTIGNDANILVSNFGESTTLSTDHVGFVDGNQFEAALPFAAGKKLTLLTNNHATISGNSTEVGKVVNQIVFNDTCTFDDGTLISASNLGQGTVDGSQIQFLQGFNLLSGSATLQAINQGSLSGYGIEVQNGSGGNVNVSLGNSSLYVSSPSTFFVIGALNGDSTSYVQSLPLLVIETDAGVNANFAGDIRDYSSPSSLVKSGPGSQKLSGTNTFTGLTTVDDGTLILTGSLAGNVNVNANGILKGTGSIAGEVVNLGTIAPGESIGTIHFLSNFTNNGGNYDVEVSGTGASDLIQVTGNALLDGGLVIVSSVDGTYKFQDRYTIVSTTGTRSGFYEGANAISSMIQPVVTYDDQHVYLTLLTHIQNAAKTPNQLAVAQQLDGIVNPNAAQNLLLSELVDLPTSEAQKALDSLSGYQHAADLITTQMINRQFIRRLYDPLRPIVTTEPNCCCESTCCDSCCCSDLTGWIDVGGSYINIRDRQEPGLTGMGYNITVGAQATFCNNLTFGVAGGYENDHLSFKHGSSKERSKTWLAGLYGLYRPNCFYALADFVYANSTNHLHRCIDVGDLHFRAKSNPDTHLYSFYGEVGMDINLCGTLIQPFFGLEAGSFHRKHVCESFADGWGLSVDKRKRSLTTTRLGLHLTSNDFCYCGSSVSLDLAWNYLVSPIHNRLHERFLTFGTPFEISWRQLNRNSIDYAVTFSTPIYGNLRGYVEGAGESWQNANIFTVLAGFEFCW